QPVGDTLELQSRKFVGARLPQLCPFLIAVECVEQNAMLDGRLDAVERGIGPLNRAIFALRIARQQGLALFADVLEDRAGLENLDDAVTEARHLVERLLLQIIDRPLLAEQAHSIVESRFLERPADA